MRLMYGITAALIVSAISLPSRAELLLDQVPADTLGFFAWQGSSGPGFQGSNFQQLISTTNMWQRLTQMKNGAKPSDIAAAQMFFAAPSVMYLQKLDSQQDKNQAVIISKIGPMAQMLATQINAEAKPNIHARQEGDLLILEMGEGTHHSVSGGNILSQEKFKTAAAQVNAQSAAIAYVDCEKMLRQFDAIITAKNNPNERRGWAMMSDVMGLEGFRQLIWTGNFAGKEWETQTFVAMSSPRAGLPAFLDNKPMTQEAQKCIPAQAAWAGEFRFDATRFIGDIRDGVSRVEPTMAQQMDAGLDMGKQMMGFDVERDLAASLGDEWFYFNTATDTPLGQNAVLINVLRDGDAAAKSLHGLSKFVSMQMAQRSTAGKNFETRVVDGLELNVLSIPNYSPTWAIEEGRLLFALNPDAVVAAHKQLAAATADTKNTMRPLEFSRNMKRGPLTSFSFYDLAVLAPQAYANMKAELAKKSPENVDALPPLEQITPYLTAANSACWQDEAGWHAQGKEAFPFSALLIEGVATQMKAEPTTQPAK